MSAMRGGFGAEVTGEYEIRVVAKPQAARLQDVAAGIPGPVGSRVCAEAPFEAERERKLVLRGNAVVAECELVGELGSRGQEAADRLFQTDTDRKGAQRFVSAMHLVHGVVAMCCSLAAQLRARVQVFSPVASAQRCLFFR